MISGLGGMPGVRHALAWIRRTKLDVHCFRVYTLALADVDRRSSQATLPDGYRFAEVSQAELRACPFPELRRCDAYGGEGSRLFAILRGDGAPVCLQCVWFGERYRRHAFWPLGDRDAASVHLVTAVSERRNGLATLLKQWSARRLKADGFSRLYSRIWWTNSASLRVSEKAGWQRVGTVVEIYVPWRATPIRRMRVERSVAGERQPA